MSKQFIISESERKKILSLYGLINEVAEENKKEISAQNYFAPGYHSDLNPKIKASIKQQLESAKTFIKEKENEGKIVFIRITSSESDVPNHDNEKGGVEVPKGWLRERRAETMKKYISSILETWGDLTIIPPFEPFVFSEPIEKYAEGDNKKDPRFDKDIWVKIDMEVKPADACLVGLGVEVMYTDKPDANFPCRGNHRCNEALFNVKLNGVIIGSANLNNGIRGGDVKAPMITVTPQSAEQIGKNSKNGLLTLSLQCLYSSCHSATPEIRISKNGAVIIHTCTSLMTRNDNREVTVLVLDLCGNIIPKNNETANAGILDKLSTLATASTANQTTPTTKIIYVKSDDGTTPNQTELDKIISAKLIVLDTATKKYKWIGASTITMSSKNTKYPSQTVYKDDIIELKPTKSTSFKNDNIARINEKYTELYNSGKIIKQSLGGGLPEQYIWVDKNISVDEFAPGSYALSDRGLKTGWFIDILPTVRKSEAKF